jgi:cysteine desulfurase
MFVPVRVYLDYQTTCPLLPEAREVMRPFLAHQFGSSSSLHQAGLFARQAMGQAREQIGGLINAESPDSIIFTGSGTEATNLAVKGAALALQRNGKHLVMSTAEQPAVFKSGEWLETIGFSSTKVPVDGMGRMDIAALEAAIRPDTTLVCVHHGNADIGTIQDLKRIGELTSARGLTLFVDATASAGWVPLDVQAVKADLVAMAPHRFYGPKGVGALYRHRRARIAPLIHGGEQEGGKRAGTENIAGIVGAGKAAEVAARELTNRQTHTRELQKRMFAEILRCVPQVRLNGPGLGPERMPNSLNLSIEFAEGEGLALMLDVKGVAIASGAACVTRTMRVPPVLAAIGLPESLAKGNVILSFGQETTEAEIQYAVEALAMAAATLREMSPLWEEFKGGRMRSELEN